MWFISYYNGTRREKRRKKTLSRYWLVESFLEHFAFSRHAPLYNMLISFQHWKGLLLEVNKEFWCSTCSKPASKKRCPRPPEELAQIGLQIGIFKRDFTDVPFKEDHPQMKQMPRKRKSKIADDKNFGANVPVNQDTAKSISDVNDPLGVSKGSFSGVC